MIKDYSIFDTLIEPIFVLEENGKIFYCNEAAAILCDSTVRKLQRGTTLDSVLAFNETIDALQDLKKVIEPTPYKEILYKNSANTEGRIQITIQPIKHEEGNTRWLIFVKDVTLEERLQKKYRAELEQKENFIVDLQKAKEQLEDYSKNLEQKVLERTKEISSLNQKMTALLDSLDQGFFIFDQNGACLDVFSKACASTLTTNPAGKMVWDVLKIDASKVEGFKKWMKTIFSEMLPFQDLSVLGPRFFPHPENNKIQLDYFPLRSDKNAIEGIVVVATDITSLVNAQEQAEREKSYAHLIINFINKKREIVRFIQESNQMIEQLNNQMQKTAYDKSEVFRYLHTLKGGAASFAVVEMAKYCHNAEDQLQSLQNGSANTTLEDLRQSIALIKKSYDNFLIQAQEILGPKVLSEDSHLEVSKNHIFSLINKVQKLKDISLVAQTIQQELLMEPVTHLFNQYLDLPETLGQKEGKRIKKLAISSSSILVFPDHYSSLAATCVHAIRNSVDHAIETPDVRLQAGKNEEGLVSVHFELTNKNEILFCIEDDGAGINPQLIRQRLLKKGYDAKSESDFEVIQHIFDSEFSTKEIITELSGRGVGMEAVKKSAEDMGGTVWVESTLGKGTQVYIKVPYFDKIAEQTYKAA